MTAAEMMREAEIIYESIASQDAPGYEPREWSYLLTQAQEEILQEIVDLGADRDDQGRIILAPITEHFSDDYSLIDYEATIPIPENLYLPGAEEAEYDDERIPIVPAANDYVVANRRNPFTRPYEELWWRVMDEYSSGDGQFKIISHVETGNFDYHLVYYRKPLPIIVEDLTGGEEIEGETTVTDCELHPNIHRRIVSRAALLAKAYTPEQIRLQTQAATKQIPAS